MGQKMENLLQALRAGGMDSTQLYERFGPSISNYLEQARRKGYLDLKNDIYTLSEKGKKECPNRRDPKIKRTTSNQYMKAQAYA